MNHKFGFIVIPEGKVFSTFDTLIEKYGKKLHTPTYPPHLTLMHTVEGNEKDIINQVQSTARTIKPFKVEVGPVEFSTTFFQCVFARVYTTAELLNAHLNIKSALDSQEKHVFMPHISIVYGDLSMQAREKISQEIILPKLSFVVDHIIIVNGDQPDPKTWNVIKRVSLGGN